MYTLEQAFKDIQQILFRTINQNDFLEIQKWFHIYDPEYIKETIDLLRVKKGKIGNLVYFNKVLQNNIFDYEERKKAIQAMKEATPTSNLIDSLQTEQEKTLYQEFLKWKEEKAKAEEKPKEKKTHYGYEEGYISPKSAYELLTLIDPDDDIENRRRVREIIAYNKERGFTPNDYD